MDRVRCDRRDGNVDVCTECAQRGFACVDDESKIGKILRRGRKIQELEALYGQYPPGQRPNEEEVRRRLAAAGARTVSGSSSNTSRPLKKDLNMEFFSSDFFKWFQMQFPVLDPAEFIDRYDKFVKRGVPLGECGELIAQTLLAWATSFGFDESGIDASLFEDVIKVEEDDPFATIERRKAATNEIVQDILEAIDKNAVARRTSWDGVRVLLLLLPLTTEVLPSADRANLYRSALHQVYSISGIDVRSEKPLSVDGTIKEVARARIVWHAIVNEGITSALNGTKLIFDQDDADSFQPPYISENYNAALQACPVTAHLNSDFTFFPCHLAAVCRLINECLTSPKAERLAACGKEDVTHERLELIWSALEESWNEFDSLRGTGEFTDSLEEELRETFVSGWQIFIYGIHNTIREKLWERIRHITEPFNSRDSARQSMNGSTLGGATLTGGMDLAYTDFTAEARLRELMALHDMAKSRCSDRVARVLGILRHHTDSSFFELDAGLVEPGIVFAAEHFASNPESLEEFNYCIDALQKMRWAFSKGESQVERLNALWDSKRAAEAKRARPPQQRLLSSPLHAPFDTGIEGHSAFSLDSFQLAGGSVLNSGPLPQFQLQPASNIPTRYWQTSSLQLSPLNLSTDGASEGSRKSSSAFSAFELGSSPISPTRSLSQGSSRSDSPIDDGQQGDNRRHYMGRFQPYEDFLPITPGIPGLSLPSGFNSPTTDIVRAPAAYGAPIINAGRMESPPYPQIVAPLSQLGGHGTYLDSVIPMAEHPVPEAHEMSSTHSSISSSSVYSHPSLEASLPQCDQPLDVLQQYLAATSFVPYATTHSGSAFSL
ncbi:hypothetical protein FRC05_004665 [Tulasnella sp. 425]|nr:hypothetical protein FRC05_004665 [Tulasnella sp. 425]